jgi:serine phosphatase RsbU (regulator of sigma subunit)
MYHRQLQAIAPHALADRIVAEGRRVAGVPVGLYLVDLDGSCLMRMAGSPGLPERLAVAHAIGPEIPTEGFPDLVRRVREQVTDAEVTPMRLYGRAVAVLIAQGRPAASLQELADAAAVLMENASSYTDVFQVARRRQPISAAAEIQQNMLPPRLAMTAHVELAAAILPAYAVGGDWFEHADNPDGLWFAVADGVGKGDRAAALAALALGAFRSARRNGCDLEEAVAAIHAALLNMPDLDFVTAVIARWCPPDLHWINCGHPYPLLVNDDGSAEELRGHGHMPLGLELGGPGRTFTMQTRSLTPGQRLVLYSDGVSERRREDGGLFGAEGIAEVMRANPGGSAVGSVSALLAAVRATGGGDLRDDATVLVLRPTPGGTEPR